MASSSRASRTGRQQPIGLASCPVLAELLEQGRSLGRSGKVFDDLSALSTRSNVETLHSLMLHLEPTRTLEVGLAFGGSALSICTAHRDLGRPPTHQHVAIDPYQTTVWDSCGLEALERASLLDYVEFHEANSALALPKLLIAESEFGFAYIDGSHLFEDVFVDAYFVLRMIVLGGVVAFDDSTNPHVAKVLRFLRRNCKAGLREMDLTAFRTRRGGLPYRLARRLGKVQLTAFQRVGSVERAWNSQLIGF